MLVASSRQEAATSIKEHTTMATPKVTRAHASNMAEGNATISPGALTNMTHDVSSFMPKSSKTTSEAYMYATTHTWDVMYERAASILGRTSCDDMADGNEWYVSYAPSIIMHIADTYATDYTTVAAVMAVFSSTCGWQQNIVATDRFIRAYMEGARGRSLPAVVRNGLAMRKAEALMGGADPEGTIVSRKASHVQSWKTLCFYWNLTGQTDRVTVDVWMWRALSSDPDTQYRPEGWHYMMCESVLMALAENVGMSGPALQAALWVTIRGKAD
jgi:hypothetical protein